MESARGSWPCAWSDNVVDMSVLSVKMPFWLPSRSELPAVQIVKVCLGSLQPAVNKAISMQVVLPLGTIGQAVCQVPEKCLCCSSEKEKRVGSSMLSAYFYFKGCFFMDVISDKQMIIKDGARVDR